MFDCKHNIQPSYHNVIMVVTDSYAVRKWKFHANNITFAQSKIFFKYL
jgi:hypothetical protein